MERQLERRSILAAGALIAALTACRGTTSSGTSTDESPPQLLDYGYDPDVAEPLTPEPPARGGKVPPAASVQTEWLPPVGRQTMPNCYVWASVYGLATFLAAERSQTPPTNPARQASPDYSYIRYQEANKIAGDTCQGGQITRVLNWLKSNGGTASLAQAPNLRGHKPRSSCEVNWTAYGSQPIPPDPNFLIADYKSTPITGRDGLDNLRTIIASGRPIVYGTSLYTDFSRFRGTAPYVGNGKWLVNNNGKRAGHVMLIIAYDDAYTAKTGAVRIQNSFGRGWGHNGYMWMAYDALEAMAQGGGVYVPKST